MDKSLLMFTGGVRSGDVKLADGNEYKVHFKSKTPDEVTLFLGAERRYTNDDAGDLAREKGRAKFIAASLCNEAGEPFMTEAEARMIPASFKPVLCNLIVEDSSKVGADVGNVLPPETNSGSGTP